MVTVEDPEQLLVAGLDKGDGILAGELSEAGSHGLRRPAEAVTGRPQGRRDGKGSGTQWSRSAALEPL